MIVENQHFLLNDAACATYWAEGYLAWGNRNIRPIDPPIQVIAKRKLYRIELML
jgi:hypothetical protein